MAITEELETRGYSAQERQAFTRRLRTHLCHTLRRVPIAVIVDPDDPLMWVGDNKNVLALNVLASPQVLAERAVAEEFVRHELGVDQLPSRFPAYSPHVAVARFRPGTVPEEARDCPKKLLDSTVPSLGSIALEELPAPLPEGVQQYAGAVA
ncbi:MAG TPA: hypothetical protein VLF69_02675 [Candidatus Saccharimonadales bacterium]|nr:hypothetical protein [Candidatus Saccharimonadales bacterium]